jgi:hypothetical protein
MPCSPSFAEVLCSRQAFCCSTNAPHSPAAQPGLLRSGSRLAVLSVMACDSRPAPKGACRRASGRAHGIDWLLAAPAPALQDPAGLPALSANHPHALQPISHKPHGHHEADRSTQCPITRGASGCRTNTYPSCTLAGLESRTVQSYLEPCKRPCIPCVVCM